MDASVAVHKVFTKYFYMSECTMFCVSLSAFLIEYVYRNNLTIIDVVAMQGQGGYGELRFSNRKPGSQKPLIFEMSDKQLKQCDSKLHPLLCCQFVGEI